jgi:uncharacterized membrane protein YeaQ/YmgE (transglycosylase-associated protein family)
LPNVPLWLHWVILGFVAGALAKFLLPGRDPAGCLVTTGLGVIGAVLGGWIGTRLGWGTVTADHFHPRSLALATLGAILVLILGRILRGRPR